MPHAASRRPHLRRRARTGGRARAAAPADELQIIPGVGPSIAEDLRDLNVRRVADLKGKDPEVLYDRLCLQRGVHQDRCLLYVFRCAVYFASTARPNAEKLKWWNWKD
jgi:predicted flap endonuclease-1-like 5' DNA nuclease